MISAFLQFQVEKSDTLLPTIKIYVLSTINTGTSTLNKERIVLCKRKTFETRKYPPENGAFNKHFECSPNQVQQWNLASLHL